MNENFNFKKYLYIITALRGMSSFSYYLFIPFFGIWLVQQHIITVMQTSVVVGVCVFMTRAASVVMPYFIRRIGEKTAVALAYVGTDIVFATMFSYKGGNVLVWDILSGILGVAFSVATLGIKSIVGKCFTEERRFSAYSYLNVAVNVGAAAGPAIGGWIMAENFHVLPLVAVGFQILAVLIALFLPQPQAEPIKKTAKVEIRVSGSFLLFLVVSSLTWIAYVQLYNVFPIFAQGHLDDRLVGSIFSINGILIILVQIPVSRYLEKAIRSNTLSLNMVLLISNVLLACSMLCIATARTNYWYFIFVGVALFTLSELLWSPLYDSAVMQIRGGLEVVTAFGISGLIWGLAESLGSSFGMVLIGNGGFLHSISPFLLGFCAALLAGLCGYALRILQPKKSQSEVIREQSI